LKKADRIIFKTKKAIFTEKIGNNRSKFKGEGYDFAELREYQIGDDIRKIDWNITAKLHQPFIKLFNEERELNIVAVPILSGSTFFGSKVLKIDFIAEIIGTLGFSAIKNHDSFSTFIFSGDEVKFFKPSKKNFNIEKAIEIVSEINPIGKAHNFEKVIPAILNRIKRKSLIFLISDFYEKPNLKYLAKHSEVISVIVRDRFEENPPAFGNVTLVDPISQKHIEGDFNSWQGYKTRLKTLDRDIYQDMKRAGARILKIYTDQNIQKEFRRFFG
jgi:uncharacterized protein (DUF58 family)